MKNFFQITNLGMQASLMRGSKTPQHWSFLCKYSWLFGSLFRCLFLFKIATISACKLRSFLSGFHNEGKKQCLGNVFFDLLSEGKQKAEMICRTLHLMQHNNTHHVDIFSCSKRFSIDNSADKYVEKYVQGFIRNRSRSLLV